MVANVAEPTQHESLGVFGALNATGAVRHVVDVTTKFMQRPHRSGAQSRGDGVGKQGLEQAELVCGGKCTQLRQRGVTDTAFGRGDGTQKRGVVVVVDQQT